MVEATARLLQLRGYYGTSLNDILEASGAPRGSLYFHFPGGKDQLVLEATRKTVDEVTELLVEAEQPRCTVAAHFDATVYEVLAAIPVPTHPATQRRIRLPKVSRRLARPVPPAPFASLGEM